MGGIKHAFADPLINEAANLSVNFLTESAKKTAECCLNSRKKLLEDRKKISIKKMFLENEEKLKIEFSLQTKIIETAKNRN